jgi:glycosyltransferase involved in cell wall biosynthesis
MWPDILEEVPDAELHIFYGWNLFDMVNNNNPERMAWKAKVEKLMKQKGIFHHGRVGQQDIVDETFRAGFWAYPTHFYEISCITAMKCQAAGAIPVVCDYAALKETVQHGVKIPITDKDIYDDEIFEQYKSELIKMMKKSPDQLEKIRKPMMKWAKEKFSWSKIAEQWDGEFKDDSLINASKKLIEERPDLAKYLPYEVQESEGLDVTY